MGERLPNAGETHESVGSWVSQEDNTLKFLLLVDNLTRSCDIGVPCTLIPPPHDEGDVNSLRFDISLSVTMAKRFTNSPSTSYPRHHKTDFGGISVQLR
eukprot:1194867-Prorocentrum_minimum.AAC.4